MEHSFVHSSQALSGLDSREGGGGEISENENLLCRSSSSISHFQNRWETSMSRTFWPFS